MFLSINCNFLNSSFLLSHLYPPNFFFFLNNLTISFCHSSLPNIIICFLFLFKKYNLLLSMLSVMLIFLVYSISFLTHIFHYLVELYKSLVFKYMLICDCLLNYQYYWCLFSPSIVVLVVDDSTLITLIGWFDTRIYPQSRAHFKRLTGY